MMKYEQEHELWTMITQEVELSMHWIMRSYSCITQVCFEGSYGVLFLCYDDVYNKYAYYYMASSFDVKTTCNDVCLTWIIAMSCFPWYDWLKVDVPLSMRNKLRMRSKYGNHEWGPRVSISLPWSGSWTVSLM